MDTLIPLGLIIPPEVRKVCSYGATGVSMFLFALIILRYMPTTRYKEHVFKLGVIGLEIIGTMNYLVTTDHEKPILNVLLRSMVFIGLLIFLLGHILVFLVFTGNMKVLMWSFAALGGSFLLGILPNGVLEVVLLICNLVTTILPVVYIRWARITPERTEVIFSTARVCGLLLDMLKQNDIILFSNRIFVLLTLISTIMAIAAAVYLNIVYQLAPPFGFENDTHTDVETDTYTDIENDTYTDLSIQVPPDTKFQNLRIHHQVVSPRTTTKMDDSTILHRRRIHLQPPNSVWSTNEPDRNSEVRETLSCGALKDSPQKQAELERSPVSVQDVKGPTRKLGGAVSVINKSIRYAMQSDDEIDFNKISTGENEQGNPDDRTGIFRCKGYPIDELAANKSFLEICYLLVYGNLPSVCQLADWEYVISEHYLIPRGVLDNIQAICHDVSPIKTFVSAMSSLSVLRPNTNPTLNGQDLVRDKLIVHILGKAPAIAAVTYLKLSGRSPVRPSSSLSYCENFLYMLYSGDNRAYNPDPRLARVLNVIFILHAEHQLNFTAAVTHLTPSDGNVFNLLAQDVDALYGPLHTEANEGVNVITMLNEIGRRENIPDFIEGVKNRKMKLWGFGEYKKNDPRVGILKKLAEEVITIVGHDQDPLIEVAIALENAILLDEYLLKNKLRPTIDFYLGLIYRAMGFQSEFFPVLFAIPRVPVFLSRWLESFDDPGIES